MKSLVGILEAKIKEKWLSSDGSTVLVRVQINKKGSNEILNDVTVKCPYLKSKEKVISKISDMVNRVMKETERRENKKLKQDIPDLNDYEGIENMDFEYDPEKDPELEDK